MSPSDASRTGRPERRIESRLRAPQTLNAHDVVRSRKDDRRIGGAMNALVEEKRSAQESANQDRQAR